MTHLVTFVGISALCLYIISTKKLELLLSPKLYWTVYFSGASMGLFLLALGNLTENYTSLKGKVKKLLLGILYVYPAILFLLVNPSELQNVNKNVIKEIKQVEIKKVKPIEFLPVDEYGYVKLNLFELWLLAKNHPYLLNSYKFKTVGKVENVYGNTLTLQRSFITCCVADATPVEVEVHGISGPRVGDWIEVWGKVIVKDYVIIFAENYIKTDPKGFISVWSEKPPFNP